MKTKRVFSLCVIVLCFVFMATISSASNLYADGKIIKKGQPNSRGFSFCETAEEEEKDFPSWEECYIVTYKIPNWENDIVIGMMPEMLVIPNTDFNNSDSVDILVSQCLYLKTGILGEELPAEFEYTIDFPERTEYKDIHRKVQNLSMEDISARVSQDK